MENARMVARAFADNDLGIDVSEDVLEIISDISAEVIASHTKTLQAKLNDLNVQIESLKATQVKACLICQENVAEYMWSSCFTNSSSRVVHLTACYECADKIMRGPETFRRCPLCRAGDPGFWLKVDARA